MKNFATFWKNIFVYKGTASVSEYWAGVLTLIIPNVICFICAIVTIANVQSEGFTYKLFSALSVAFLVIAIAAFIPFVSLTVRRLHAVSKSGWWAGLLLFIGVGLIILMLMCSGVVSTFASFVPSVNINGCVYGPPENFDPSQNMIEDVYGPPAPEPKEKTEPEEEFHPELNYTVDVYGPPEMYVNDEE